MCVRRRERELLLFYIPERRIDRRRARVARQVRGEVDRKNKNGMSAGSRMWLEALGIGMGWYGVKGRRIGMAKFCEFVLF